MAQDIELRFLETFLIVDYLTGQFDGDDAGRAEREELFNLLQAFVRQAHPNHQNRIDALKHVILQAPLRQRLHLYLGHLGLDVDDRALGRMLRIRNDVAHARTVDKEELKQVELEARQLAREVMRRELAARGMTFVEADRDQGVNT